MEDGASSVHGPGDRPDEPSTTCPPPPDPNVNQPAVAAIELAKSPNQSDLPLDLASEQWDITTISALGALRMLVSALETIAEATGDVPPTPPISRPTTPVQSSQRRAATSRMAPIGTDEPPVLHIGSPEAHMHEPITEPSGTCTPTTAIQHAAIARRFFSKVAPSFSLADYLNRLHHWCPHSPAVYLAAAAYVYKLCAADHLVPATSRTIHRLSLAAIRVGAKVLEDNKWAQERIAKVGGVSTAQLMNLEVTLCFLLDFDLFVDREILARKMYLLQQVAKQGYSFGMTRRAPFHLRPPPTRARAR